MLLLTDNDVLLKLAACDLFNEAFGALGGTYQDVRTLPTARYVFHAGKPAKSLKRWGPDITRRFGQFFRTAQAIDWVDETHPAAAELGAIDAIDAGEALLFAAAIERDDSLVLTGDKRCLKAMMQSPSCSATRDSLAGRVVCFEQIIRKSVDARGFAQCCRRLSDGATSVDEKMLLNCLGSPPHEEARFLAAIDGYIARIRVDTAGLLVP